MDHESIKLILESNAAMDLGAKVKDTAFPAVALPDNYKVSSLEGFQEHRNYFRAEFSTTHITSFTSYYAGMDSAPVVYVDPSRMTAACIYDIGSIEKPGHCKHQSSLNLLKTPSFAEFERLAGKELTQRRAAEFIEDWALFINAFDEEGKEIMPKNLIATIRRITVESLANVDSSVGNYSQNKSAMQSVEAKSSAGSLPAVIVLSVVPYAGLPEYEFNFRMTIKTDDSIGFIFRRIREEEDSEKIADSFVEVLKGLLPADSGFLQGIYSS